MPGTSNAIASRRGICFTFPVSYVFLKAFLRDLDVASVCPTSPVVVNHVLKRVDFRRRLVVVEYGPGTGAFTAQLLQRLTWDSKLLLIEKNGDFVRVLREKFGSDSRVHLFHASAERVEELLREIGESSADYIISGIPFSRIPKPQAMGIMQSTKRAIGDGAFLVYQFLPSVKKLLSPVFACVTVKFMMWNIPPLFLFVAQR
jgi:phospholipid N-methyltransferase